MKNKLLLVKPLRSEIYLLEQGLVNTPGKLYGNTFIFVLPVTCCPTAIVAVMGQCGLQSPNYLASTPLQKKCADYYAKANSIILHKGKL